MRKKLSMSIASVLVGAALLVPQPGRAAGQQPPAANVPTQNGKSANQMGKMKNTERWAAAIRAANRRAAALRAGQGNASPGKGK